MGGKGGTGGPDTNRDSRVGHIEVRLSTSEPASGSRAWRQSRQSAQRGERACARACSHHARLSHLPVRNSACTSL
eukprot:4540796-Pleurochrysis_carterae.AAC.2